MIIVVKKNKVILIAMLFLISVMLYSLNIFGGISASSAISKDFSGVTVLLDAGHGGEDPGAVSDYSALKEKDINLNIAIKLKELLEAESFKVVMTRTEDRLEYSDKATNIIKKRKQDLQRRKKIMDNSSIDAVVSIHLNKFPKPQYSGAQVFFPENSPKSQKLASDIQVSLKELVDPNNQRAALVKKEPIIILKDCVTTTAVVECGFLSNPDEEKKLCQKEYQDNLAVAIKEGVVRYFTDVVK